MIDGLGMYIWQVKACEEGNIESIVKTAIEMSFTHVLVKIADGPVPYNSDYVKALIPALKKAGISVFGWQYIYGTNPKTGNDQSTLEAIRASAIINQLDLDGFVVDAEKEYETRGSAKRALNYMEALREGVGGDFEISLSSFRFPTYHRTFPFNEFLTYCDFSMPQIYWVRSHTPVDQLVRTKKEYAALEVTRPIFPTGAAYKEAGWQPTPGEVNAFIRACKEQGYSGCNFWSWQHARQLPEIWEVIHSASWANPPAEPLPDPDGLKMRVLIDGLKIRRAPSTLAPVVGYLSQGDILRIATKEHTETWAKLSDGTYAAVLVDGRSYMEAVDA